MNKADFIYNGNPRVLHAPDVQMLQAGLARFASPRLHQIVRAAVPMPVRRILDAGACIGYYTMMFRDIWPEAEITALEPSSTNFHYLMLNTAGMPGVRQLPLAAGEGTYTHSIAIPTLEQKTLMNYGRANSGIISMFGESDIYREDVPVVKLDDLIDWCDFIKIDVEGWEAKVIRGADRLLKESRPGLHVEFTPANLEMAGSSPQELHDLIASYDYVKVANLHLDIMYVPREKWSSL